MRRRDAEDAFRARIRATPRAKTLREAARARKRAGAALTQAMQARGMMIKDLAEASGMSWKTIQNWRQGRCSPASDEARARAVAALGCDPWEGY
jgi:DNA-binding transcriptional regulator YiaG